MDETMAVVSTNGVSSARQTKTDPTIDFAVIDNENYVYHLIISDGATGGPRDAHHLHYAAGDRMKAKATTILITALFLTPAVLADGPPASGGPYTLQNYTIDSTGGEAGGGDYELRLTIAQPDAGEVLMGGALDLRGGFWTGVNNAEGTIFKDGFK